MTVSNLKQANDAFLLPLWYKNQQMNLGTIFGKGPLGPFETVEFAYGTVNTA